MVISLFISVASFILLFNVFTKVCHLDFIFSAAFKNGCDNLDSLIVCAALLFFTVLVTPCHILFTRVATF